MAATDTQFLLIYDFNTAANFSDKIEVNLTSSLYQIASVSQAATATQSIITLVQDHCLSVGDKIVAGCLETCPDGDGVYDVVAIVDSRTIQVDFDTSQRSHPSTVVAYLGKYLDPAGKTYLGEIEVTSVSSITTTENIAGDSLATVENGAIVLDSNCTNVRPGDIFSNLQGYASTIKAVSQDCECESVLVPDIPPPAFEDARWQIFRQVTSQVRSTGTQPISVMVEPQANYNALMLQLPSLPAGSYPYTVWSESAPLATYEFSGRITYA